MFFLYELHKDMYLTQALLWKVSYLLHPHFIELKSKKSARLKIFRGLLTPNEKDNENVPQLVLDDKHPDTIEVQQFFACTL